MVVSEQQQLQLYYGLITRMILTQWLSFFSFSAGEELIVWFVSTGCIAYSCPIFMLPVILTKMPSNQKYSQVTSDKLT